MHSLRRVVAAATVLLATLAVSAPADAHQSPSTCNTSGVNLQFKGNDIFTIHRNGDEVSVIPQVSNNANNVCDVTDATITVHFPKADGTPGPGQVVATGLDLPAGTPPTLLPEVKDKLELNDGLFRGEVEMKISGTFHWLGTHTTGPMGTLSSNFAITRPHATINVTTDPATPDAFQPVTYKYAVVNDSPHDPSPGALDPAIHDHALTDDRCGPIPSTHTGDTNMNQIQEPGETWVYSCTTALPGGMFTNNVSLTATSVRDGRPWPATTGQGTVTVNGPDMTLAKSHSGDFVQGDKGRTYSLVARNSGNRPASGDVNVADTLPSGLTATAIAGEGWDCTLGTLTCARSDMLAAGEAYPPITVTVDVAADAPASVTNTAKVTRAGQNTENDNASDATTIAPPPAEEPEPKPEETPGGETPGGGTGEQPGGGDTGGQTGGDTGEQPGGGTDGPQTNEDQTPRDTTAPALSGLSISNRTFAVAAPRVASARVKKGTRFGYTLSESARVTFTIERRTVSRRTGRVRYVRVGAFTQNGAAGANRRRWLGTLGSKAVRPGTYRASIAATDAAGNKSAARRVGFKVVRR
jgi:uncharacterized repeat protein (TIGR01451 family)